MALYYGKVRFDINLPDTLKSKHTVESTLPAGGIITPALFVRTCSFSSLYKKSSTDFLIDGKSARSSFKNSSRPFESGATALISSIALLALSGLRPAT